MLMEENCTITGQLDSVPVLVSRLIFIKFSGYKFVPFRVVVFVAFWAELPASEGIYLGLVELAFALSA